MRRELREAQLFSREEHMFFTRGGGVRSGYFERLPLIIAFYSLDLQPEVEGNTSVLTVRHDNYICLIQSWHKGRVSFVFECFALCCAVVAWRFPWSRVPLRTPTADIFHGLDRQIALGRHMQVYLRHGGKNRLFL